MKTLYDNTLVPSRTYYYLLDWNERNEKRFMADTFNKHRLCDLTKEEYKILFDYATSCDAKILGCN